MILIDFYASESIKTNVKLIELWNKSSSNRLSNLTGRKIEYSMIWQRELHL